MARRYLPKSREEIENEIQYIFDNINATLDNNYNKIDKILEYSKRVFGEFDPITEKLMHLKHAIGSTRRIAKGGMTNAGN